jgi:predicted MFS family arabinose efflux permease
MGGGYHPAAPPMIAASVQPQNRGQALGFHMWGGSASFFLSPIIAAAIATAWGWRAPFIWLAVPTMLFGILFYVLLGRREVAKKAEPKTTSTHGEASPAPGRWRHLVAFMILSTTIGAATWSAVPLIALFLVDHFGVAAETAPVWIAFTIYLAGFWASPLGGYLSDRWGRVPVILAVCFLTGPVFYLLNLASFPWGIIPLLVAIGMITYVRMPVSEAYIISHTSERHRSTVLGIYYFSTLEGGGVITPVLGYLIDQYGFHYTFTTVGIAVFAVTLVCAILLRDSRD